MIRPFPTSPILMFDSTSIEELLRDCVRSGPEQIPVLEPCRVIAAPTGLTAFDRVNDRTPSSNAAHFYVSDHKLPRVAKHPHRYASRLGGLQSVLTPDFSIYREMKRHQRIGHTYLSRALGVIFQRHGLDVIPSIRWSTSDDFDFSFEGVPVGSTVAVSTHGCSRSPTDQFDFRRGLIELIGRLTPERVLVHGPFPDSIFRGLDDRTELISYESEITSSRMPHRKRSDDPRLPFVSN